MTSKLSIMPGIELAKKHECVQDVAEQHLSIVIYYHDDMMIQHNIN